jgi:serralysin
MRQFGLDTVYAGLSSEQSGKSQNQNYVLEVNDTNADGLSVFDFVTQGYGHDKALTAYVGEAFDVMIEAVLDRGSLDIEDDTLYCCACAACSGEQEAGPVLIDGYVTLASLLEAEISYGTDETFLSNVLADIYGMDTAEAAQFLFNPTTGEFVWVEGFNGVLTKGATLSVNDGLGVVNGGGVATTATAAATGDQRIDAVINGDYWAGGSISYAFSLSAAAYEFQ